MLSECRLRPGVALEGTARFRDDRWPLKPALLQQHQKSLVLNFADIPSRYRRAMKELCYVMLSGELPAGEPRPAVQTVHAVLAQLKHFLAWLAGQRCAPGGPALTTVSGADLQDYHRHLTEGGASAGSRQNKRGAVRYLWRYRESLISDRLSFDPHHADGWLETRKNSPAENATDRIPEAVHGPLLAWSLRFISDFAPDILAADQQWHLLHRPGQRWRAAGRRPS